MHYSVKGKPDWRALPNLLALGQIVALESLGPSARSEGQQQDILGDFLNIFACGYEVGVCERIDCLAQRSEGEMEVELAVLGLAEVGSPQEKESEEFEAETYFVHLDENRVGKQILNVQIHANRPQSVPHKGVNIEKTRRSATWRKPCWLMGSRQVEVQHGADQILDRSPAGTSAPNLARQILLVRGGPLVLFERHGGGEFEFIDLPRFGSQANLF